MRYLLFVISILGVGYLVGCGNSGNNSSTATCPAGYVNSNNTCVVSTSSTVACQGTCQVGTVQTSQGCLPPATTTSCGVCSGMNTANQCVPGTVTSLTTGTNGYAFGANGQCTMTSTGQVVPTSYCTTGAVGGVGTPGYPGGYGGYQGGYSGGGYQGYYPGYYPGYPPSFYPGYYGYGYNYWGH